MATVSSVRVEPRVGRAVRASSARGERIFFNGMALALAATVFWGFAPSFYLHRLLSSSNVLTPSLIVHGTVFTAWMVLLVAQTVLIAAHRSTLHRRLGVVGAGLGLLMIVVGGYVAITRARLPGAPPLSFLTTPLSTVVVFPVLFGTALYFRRRTDIHKRLVLIATLEPVSAAVARLPGVAPLGPLAYFGGTDLFILMLVVYDVLSLQRIHPATFWGGVFLVASQPARILLGNTSGWLTFATWLTS